MKLKKQILCASLAVLVSVSTVSSAFADGGAYVEQSDGVYTSVPTETVGCSAEYAVLLEASTGEIISKKNSGETFASGHLAKLMTVYLTAESIRQKRISLDTEIIASPEANRMKSPVIWLDSGEKITVEELLKSICMGNANDGAFALAEGIFKSESEYVSKANEAAVSLGMTKTHFADVIGSDENTVTCAEDIAVLAAEISEYDFLGEYFLTWIDNIRSGKTELVNTNRLVRSYDGITGMKACFSEQSKNCGVFTATRNGMTLVCVIAGADEADTRFSDAKKLLDYGFAQYTLYTPQIPEEALSEIKVTHGEKNSVGVCVENISPILIKKGDSANITAVFEREEALKAPVKKDGVVGKIRFVDGEGTVFEGKIVSKENVKSMTIGLALKRLWLNLLNFS